MNLMYLYGGIALTCWITMFFLGLGGIIIGLSIGIFGLLFLIFVGCLGRGCGEEGISVFDRPSPVNAKENQNG